MYTRISPKIWIELKNGIEFFNAFVAYGKAGNKICIENPIPHKYAREGTVLPYKNDMFVPGIGSFNQKIQPYEYGHLESKGTCFWLYGLDQLKSTDNVYEEMMKLDYKDRSKVHYASPGPDRAKIRSKTYQGIAEAMANQWG